MSDLRMRLAGRNPLRDRLFAARGILAAAALVLLGFAAFGVLAWSYAVLGFAAIAAVALFGRDVSDRSHAILAQQAVEPGIGSAWIEILIRDNARNKLVTQWSEDQAFSNEPAYVTINPGERVEYHAAVSTRDLVAGRAYTVEAFFPNFDKLTIQQTIVPEK